MPGRRRRRVLVAVAVLAVVLLGIGATVWLGPDRSPGIDAAATRPLQPVPDRRPPGVVDPPPGSGLSRYTDQAVSWTPCRERLRCATVLAPLDWEQPDGPAVSLALAQRVSAKARLGSLFLNPGGPGGSGIDLVESFDGAGLEAYDLVGWDPRGVGESTPVTCFAGRELEAYVTVDVSPDDADERKELLEQQTDFGRSCLEESGVLLPHVGTTATVRDLELLRVLLDQRRLHYLGFSYGTQIGATYAQLYGDRVGRMVLDGAVALDREQGVPQAQGFERALRAFARWCAGQRCPLGADETAVLTSITDLWRGLDSKRLRVGPRQLNQTLAVGGVLIVLYEDEDAYPFLLRALDAAINGRDGRRMLALADLFTRRRPDGTYEQVNYSFPAVRCLDARETSLTEVDRDFERQLRAAPVVGPYFGPDATCARWPLAPAPPPPPITAPDAPPLVVVGSTGDSATPYEDAQDMASQLESAVLLTRRGAGHTAYSKSPCIQRVVQRFLVNGRVPRDGTIC